MKIKDPFQFKFELSVYLLSRKDLEIISVWSPSYLLTLYHFILENKTAIEKRLVQKQIKVHSDNLFPSLKFISCWGDATSKNDFEKLKKIFSNCTLQPKGLLATEAPMSIPLYNAKGMVPLIHEVFFEFRQGKNLFLIGDIKVNQEYELIITQKGGLYRYTMNDLVQVTHFFHQTPCLRFIGRSQNISDMVGEKLNEAFINSIFEQDNNLVALIPDLESKQYYLLSEKSLMSEDITYVEGQLMNSYHYKVARKLGQLNILRPLHIKNARSKINNYLIEKKQLRWGDIKSSHLYKSEYDGQLIHYLIHS